MNRLLRSRDGVVGRDMMRRARRVANEAQSLAPIGVVRGGTLRASIVASVEFRNRVPAGIVQAKARHGMWVHEGTGLYAGRGYIYPKSAPFMVFSTAYGRYNLPTDGRFYFADRIKGQKPQPFMYAAVRAAV